MPWMGRIQRSRAGCVSVPHPSSSSTLARTIETYSWLGGRPFSGYGRPQPKTIAPSCWRATLVAWLGCPGQYCPDALGRLIVETGADQWRERGSEGGDLAGVTPPGTEVVHDLSILQLLLQLFS